MKSTASGPGPAARADAPAALHDAGFVSVVVPVHNGAGTLPALLDALLAQDYPAQRYECIVVDDASTDASARIAAARAPRVRLVQAAHNCGSYAARNLGVAAAAGAVLAFTDADCAPAPDWLSGGTAALRGQGGGVVAGAVVITPSDPASAVQRYDAAFGIPQEAFARHGGFGATANLFVQREAMAAVGGFDARLRSGGDHRFCKEAQRCGLPFGYCPDAVVRHVPRTTFAELARKQARVAAGLASLHPPWTQLRILLLPLKAWRRRVPALRQVREEHWAFRLRFGLVYYALQGIGAWAYARACLRGALRPAPDPAPRPRVSGEPGPK